MKQNIQQEKSQRRINSVAWDIFVGLISYFALLLSFIFLGTFLKNLIKPGLSANVFILVPPFLLSMFILYHFRFSARRIIARVIYWISSFSMIIFTYVSASIIFPDLMAAIVLFFFPILILILILCLVILFYIERKILHLG